MTGEIITIQVGQCGNQVSKQFWSQLAKEHGIGADGKSLHPSDPNVIREDDTNVFFRQNDHNRYTPRALLFDLEPSAIADVRNCFPGFFNERNVWISKDELGAGNTWAIGYDYGQENQDEFLNMIDKEIDATGNFEGFQLIHSVAGGTGSGLGSNLLEALSDRYHKKIVNTYSVFPSSESEVVVQPYNMVLTLRRLIDNSDASVIFDNEALLNLTARVFRDPNTSYQQTNQLIASVMSSITNSLRFPGYMYNSFPSIFSTLIPTPELHFLVPSFTPFTTDFVPGAKDFKRLSAYDVILDLFDRNNSMVSRETDTPRYLAIYDALQGSVDQSDVTRAILKTQQRTKFVPWSPTSIHVNLGRKSPYNSSANSDYVSGMMLANTSSIVSVFQKTVSSFDVIFKRGAFLHKFQNGKMFQHGWDEFLESREVIQGVIDEYIAAEQENFLDDILVGEDNVVGNDAEMIDVEGSNDII
ncbi:HDL252Cp [Eremothecium sinecaudum]|uniref:Tubulin gamma chain n=1 Tax=Eremothecium sinecaudum TaxID=45286 RepID=A0A109UYX5_9SACH|nr:HDL252Cp [Eremothecium sinecaudum]AMD20492.1 HDL252Cp [Eremothecium sinecaudum]